MVIVAYFLTAAVVIFLSVRLARLTGMIQAKTNLSGAFVGGVLLAGITSTPELVTTLTSVIFLKEGSMALGNVLGSNLFNIAIIALLFLIFYQRCRNGNISPQHLKLDSYAIVIHVLLLLVLFGIVRVEFLGLNLVSVLILLTYLLSIKDLASDEGGETKDDSPLTLRQVMFRFALFSVLLIAASILITYLSDLVGKQLNLGTTLAGALLLGVATSLPELTSCFTLAKEGNLNACFGNVVGSNIFNFFILFLADLFYSQDLYIMTKQSFYLVVCGTVSSLALAVILLLKKRNSEKHLLYIVLSGIILLSYITFITLSSVSGG